MNNTSETQPPVHILLDMDSTLTSLECLDLAIETALREQLPEHDVAIVMERIQGEMDKGMDGSAPLSATIPARIAIAQQSGAPLQDAHIAAVADRIPSALTPSIVDALESACRAPREFPLTISVISGGPIECVEAAAAALAARLSDAHGNSLTIQSVGNRIATTHDGTLDPTRTHIEDSKAAAVRHVVDDPTRAVMIGDGATDVDVYDRGLVGYFIAIGIWVARDVLFARADNPPHYLKVTTATQMENAVATALRAINRGQ